MNLTQDVKSFLSIIVGVVLIGIAIGNMIFKLLIALLGLLLINYGLQMRSGYGRRPYTFMFDSWFTRRR